MQRYPVARYRSTRLAASGEEGFSIAGILTIKDRELPVRLGLAFRADGPVVSGRFEIDRADADLGMESDPAAEWVSRTIEVSVRAVGTSKE